MKKRESSEERVAKCAAKYGSKYDYSKTDFSRSKEKTTVICPIHGEFLIDFDHHFNAGQGCKFCAKDVWNTESFVEKASQIHRGKYDYSKVDYVNSHKKITITCRIHGDFEQTPNAHLNGEGCPLCANGNSSLETEFAEILESCGVSYVRQWKPEFLKRSNKSQLSVDFYIPELNVAVECQGKQHFGLGGWSKRYDFKEAMERDDAKRKLCEENGVELWFYTRKKYFPKKERPKYSNKIFFSEKNYESVKYLSISAVKSANKDKKK